MQARAIKGDCRGRPDRPRREARREIALYTANRDDE